ncbi:hypothetical protein VFPFJ_10114 [Purpureocillium lilacinum]|uniref:Uncharacterized protein n=1 Tax=Purpureocillium lilacinum TaxID=33203 RepID=A0A179GJU6_PURLI|nr:hypothetical protein VFPFJ_10114 [Purpureocillium lilacinum]OAQ78082.1 hypothetical protein VFPFJ_10114 [Purpureocillium lilacinum]
MACRIGLRWCRSEEVERLWFPRHQAEVRHTCNACSSHLYPLRGRTSTTNTASSINQTQTTLQNTFTANHVTDTPLAQPRRQGSHRDGRGHGHAGRGHRQRAGHRDPAGRGRRGGGVRGPRRGAGGAHGGDDTLRGGPRAGARLRGGRDARRGVPGGGGGGGADVWARRHPRQQRGRAGRAGHGDGDGRGGVGARARGQRDEHGAHGQARDPGDAAQRPGRRRRWRGRGDPGQHRQRRVRGRAARRDAQPAVPDEQGRRRQHDAGHGGAPRRAGRARQLRVPGHAVHAHDAQSGRGRRAHVGRDARGEAPPQPAGHRGQRVGRRGRGALPGRRGGALDHGHGADGGCGRDVLDGHCHGLRATVMSWTEGPGAVPSGDGGITPGLAEGNLSWLHFAQGRLAGRLARAAGGLASHGRSRDGQTMRPVRPSCPWMRWMSRFRPPLVT